MLKIFDVDITLIHNISCFIGAGLSLYVMQTSTKVDSVLGERALSIFLYRSSLALIGISMMWAANYSATTHWEPWPPDVLIVIAVDLTLLMRAITIAIRWKHLLKDNHHVADIVRNAIGRKY